MDKDYQYCIDELGRRTKGYQYANYPAAQRSDVENLSDESLAIQLLLKNENLHEHMSELSYLVRHFCEDWRCVLVYADAIPENIFNLCMFLANLVANDIRTTLDRNDIEHSTLPITPAQIFQMPLRRSSSSRLAG